MYLQRSWQTAEAITCSITTYTGIHDSITVTFLTQFGLQEVGPGVIKVKAETGT